MKIKVCFFREKRCHLHHNGANVRPCKSTSSGKLQKKKTRFFHAATLQAGVQKNVRKFEVNVVLSGTLRFPVSTCHPVRLLLPLKHCSLHPIHRITRDAGVSIATAGKAANVPQWAPVAGVCVCVECELHRKRKHNKYSRVFVCLCPARYHKLDTTTRDVGGKFG